MSLSLAGPGQLLPGRLPNLVLLLICCLNVIVANTETWTAWRELPEEVVRLGWKRKLNVPVCAHQQSGKHPFVILTQITVEWLGLWSQAAWVQTPPLPLTVTLGKCLNLSVSRFSHL